jgi:crotonobetainyl-CoA:carnitine CoA-transferase CaiB-like acyl-CoA transferase
MSTERAPLPTTDGLVTILAYERHHFEGLIRIGGRTEMLDDPRFMTRLGRLENIDELYREYRRIAEEYSTAEFLVACQREGVPAHEVVTLDDVVAALPLVDHPDLGAYRVTPPVVPTTDPGAPPRRPAPHLGENALEVLTELGYAPEVIDALMTAGVVGRYGQQP